jgi:hypothetical protein
VVTSACVAVAPMTSRMAFDSPLAQHPCDGPLDIPGPRLPSQRLRGLRSVGQEGIPARSFRPSPVRWAALHVPAIAWPAAVTELLPAPLSADRLAALCAAQGTYSAPAQPLSLWVDEPWLGRQEEAGHVFHRA